VGPLLEDGGTSDTGHDQDSKGPKKPQERKYRVEYKTEEIWYPGECAAKVKSVQVFVSPMFFSSCP
jgi:hypothetical protein